MTGNLIALHVNDFSIDTDKFLEFLDQIRKKVSAGSITLVVDNLAMHYTRRVHNFADETGISLLFNVTYSSENNPIEILWAFSKRRFRAELITFSDFKNKSKVQSLVRKCIEAVPNVSLRLHI